MRITTKGRYGLRAVINLARSNHSRPVSIGSIASEENVSSEFLEQIFFKLKKAGLIRSIRGPGGGFVLNRMPGEISVQDILAAVGETQGPHAVHPAAEDPVRQARAVRGARYLDRTAENHGRLSQECHAQGYPGKERQEVAGQARGWPGLFNLRG